MSIKLSEDKYKKLKKDVEKNRILVDFKGLKGDEKLVKVLEHTDTLIFDNDEERQMYIANMLVADDVKFYKTYMENGKKLKKVAEVYDVPENIILARAFELGKYHDYIGNIANKKGEEKMGEIEILDVMQVEPKVSGKTEDKKVDENTVKAIGRITQLLELTEEQEKTIEKQAKDIETKSNEISSLELTVKDMNTRIDELKDEVKRKEEEIKEQESIIASMEKEIDSYRAEIKRLSMYKDNYEKIINFLNQNIEENAAK